LLPLIELLLQPLGAIVFLIIEAFKIPTSPAPPILKRKSSRRKIYKEAGDKKSDSQREEKR